MRKRSRRIPGEMAILTGTRRLRPYPSGARHTARKRPALPRPPLIRAVYKLVAVLRHIKTLPMACSTELGRGMDLRFEIGRLVRSWAHTQEKVVQSALPARLPIHERIVLQQRQGKATVAGPRRY